MVKFGAEYRGPDGGARTHRGVDLACGAGEDITAPVSGTVCFAGRVPGSSGGTVLAMSMETDRGRITLMPLERLSVEEGASLSVGDVVGSLAQSGDPSSDSPHLHLSLRSGDLYLDPSVLLGALVSAPAEEPKPVIEPSPACAVGPAVADPVVANPAAMGEGVGLASTARISVTQLAGRLGHAAGVTAGAEHQAPAVAGEAGSMGAGVALAPLASGGIEAASAGPLVLPGSAQPISSAQSPWADLARSAIQQASAIGAPAYGALFAAVACAALILSLRSFERRMICREPVSDRLGRTLQQLRTGDTLRGLTSCSGETAFTVPGPSSPGEVTK